MRNTCLRIKEDADDQCSSKCESIQSNRQVTVRKIRLSIVYQSISDYTMREGFFHEVERINIMMKLIEATNDIWKHKYKPWERFLFESDLTC